MENTTKNKSAFYGLYIGQEIWTTPQWNNKYPVEYYFGDCWDELDEPDETRFNSDGDHIELYDISSITDEEACELVDMFSQEPYSHLHGQKIIYGKKFAADIQCQRGSWMVSLGRVLKCIRYLESKGYYIGDGKEIKYGWVKLKDKEESK